MPIKGTGPRKMAAAEGSIAVNAPVDAIYKSWLAFEDYPKFITVIKRVRKLDANHFVVGLAFNGKQYEAMLEIMFNRTRVKAEPLLGPCGTFSDSPAKLAQQVDVLLTMLAHSDAVEQAALGANGFLNHLPPNALWVDCSSVNPSFSRKMAAEAARRQIRFVDAPVTGSAPVAAEAKLIFWVGAQEVDLEASRSLLLCMGNKIVHGCHRLAPGAKARKSTICPRPVSRQPW